MSVIKHNSYIRLDPRTKILLLLLSNLLLFLEGRIELALAFMAVLTMLLLLSRHCKAVVAFGGIILLSELLNRFIFPIAPEVFTMIFSISVNYTLKMLPCLMAGALLVLTTSLHDVVLAMRSCHLPRQLIIPISVTIRYFPALLEELKHINNAMRQRTLPLASRIEGFVVPVMMAASNTVEELSAAAVTRGIENPAPKTSVTRLRFQVQDYLIMLIGLGFIIADMI